MKKIKLLIIFSLMIGFNSSGQSLEDYIKIAVENNPGLRAKYLEFESAMQKIPQMKSLPDPTFSVSAFGQMIETRLGPQEAKFSLSQMFPWFGTLKLQGDAVSLMADAKFQAWMASRNELIYQLKNNYYGLAELYETIKIQEENLEILYSYKNLTTSRFQNGKESMVNVIRVDMQIGEAVTNLKLQKDKRIPLIISFNRILNRDENDSIFIDLSDFQNVNKLSNRNDSLILNNPKLAEIDKKIQAYSKQIEVAHKQGMPKFGVGLDYIIIGERTDMVVDGSGKDAIMPMVSLTIPVYRKKYKAAIKENELMQESFASKKTETLNNLSSTYEMAWFELNKAVQMLNLANQQTDKTQNAINLLNSSYSNSGSGFEEVLRMQQQLLKYKLLKVSSTKEMLIALAKLDYITAK